MLLRDFVDNMLITNNCTNNRNIQHPKELSVAFEGYKTVFTKTLDEVILSGKCSKKSENKLLKLLNDFINKKLNDKKLLGSGFSNSVYKIDDKYALRFPSDMPPKARYFMGLSEGGFKDINLYYGEPVGEFNDEIMVLRNVSSKKHLPAGIPMGILEKLDENEIEEYCYKNYLKTYATLPQSSYDRVAKACKQLNNKGNENFRYCFDFINPNNFVLTGKTIKITDEIKDTTRENPNNIMCLLDVFINRYGKYTFAQYKAESAPLRKDIFKRVILACEKYNINDYDTLPPIEDALRLSDIKETPEDFVDNLATLREKYGQNLKKHLKIVQEYLNTL